MRKLNIAVIFGGCSPEYGVSLESAHAVIRFLDKEKYHPVMVGISEDGDWFCFQGDIDKIRENRWLNDEDCVPAVFSPNRGKHQLLCFREDGIKAVDIDAAFPVLHGKNGEDGTVQGMIELAGIPLVGCGVLASALCMDKDRAHKVVSLAGVETPKALAVQGNGDTQRAEIRAFAKQIGFPLFVKPVRAGSSYGVTKVQSADELRKAADLAFQYDDQVIIEENIDGFEVGCAVMGDDILITGEVDEIELSGGFFDFTEKYTLKTSTIHLPARISREKSDEIRETAKVIYRALNCSGFARVDMFLTPEGRIVFNEVNTIPGFTEHSRYPGMMKAAGIPIEDVLMRIIDQTMNRSCDAER